MWQSSGSSKLGRENGRDYLCDANHHLKRAFARPAVNGAPTIFYVKTVA
jgi:hypothetical protein